MIAFSSGRASRCPMDGVRSPSSRISCLGQKRNETENAKADAGERAGVLTDIVAMLTVLGRKSHMVCQAIEILHQAPDCDVEPKRHGLLRR